MFPWLWIEDCSLRLDLGRAGLPREAEASERGSTSMSRISADESGERFARVKAITAEMLPTVIAPAKCETARVRGLSHHPDTMARPV